MILISNIEFSLIKNTLIIRWEIKEKRENINKSNTTDRLAFSHASFLFSDENYHDFYSTMFYARYI